MKGFFFLNVKITLKVSPLYMSFNVKGFIRVLNFLMLSIHNLSHHSYLICDKTKGWSYNLKKKIGLQKRGTYNYKRTSLRSFPIICCLNSCFSIQIKVGCIIYYLEMNILILFLLVSFRLPLFFCATQGIETKG